MSTPLADRRILLVEDDELVARLGSMIVRDLGGEVDHTTSGSDAIERCRQGGLDLVLLDLVLPDLHGAEVTDTIRALPAPNGEVPIVWVSAYPTPPPGTDRSAASIQGICPKPFTRDQLTAVVAPIIAR